MASINYRLAHSCGFKEQIQDIFSAFSWLHDSLNDYPADMENIFLVGDSAGGQFVSVSAAICGSERMQKDFSVTPSLSFRAIGAICPAVDLASPNFIMNVNLKSLLGDKPKENPLYKYMDYNNVASAFRRFTSFRLQATFFKSRQKSCMRFLTATALKMCFIFTPTFWTEKSFSTFSALSIRIPNPPHARFRQ